MTSKGEAATSLAPLISCIDDDLEVRDALAGLLKALGFSTATFSSAESFLATGDLERTCCLITDVMLSGISGLELQARLTESGYRIPMIMITAFPEERFRAQAMGAGAVCFLNKPVTRRDLVSCIQSALHTTLQEGYRDMTSNTHQTAPTKFVEADGIRFAYRRFGKSGGLPFVFNMHFTGTMDHWDPAVTDGFAKDREVILFNNAGVSSSSGEVPTSVEEMAVNAVAFIKALSLSRVDMLGFSLGGLIAQEIAITEPELVRRLVLVGTGPRGGEGMATLTPEAQAVFGARYENPDHVWLGAFFGPSKRSQAAGHEYLKRFRLRTVGRDPEVNEKVAPAQLEALNRWGAPRENPYEYLKQISQPTLVVNGSNDVLVYSVNSFILQQNIPYAQLILYPDSNHGSQYQYPKRFVQHVSLFLSESGE